MNNLVQFNNHNLEIINKNGQRYFSAPQIGAALGYGRSDKITQIYTRHADEFTPDMSDTLKLRLSRNLETEVRVFSLRGCHLLAMFSKTPVAKEFRRWVLDLIEQQNRTVSKMETTTPDMTALSSLVRSAIKQELAALTSASATDTDMQDMRNLIAALMNNIIDGRVKNRYRHLVDEIAALRAKLDTIKKTIA